MRYLGAPLENGIEIFNAVVASKQDPIKSQLNSSASEIFIAYKNYESNTDNLGQLQAIQLSKDKKAALINAYEGRTKPVLDLKARILEKNIICPLCWISESSTLDHHLPKSAFPEFAIFPPNLVPSCSHCNNTKLNFFIDQTTGIRLFLHPYYDKLPDEPCLNLKVRVQDEGIILTFKIIQIEGMSNEIFSHISSHFKRLDLGNRYRKNALDVLTGARYGLGKLYESGANSVSEYLKKEAVSNESAFGRNYWRTVLFSTLASDHEFCDGGFRVISIY